MFWSEWPYITWLYWIGGAFLYMNIGYLVMWLGYRTAKKNIVDRFGGNTIDFRLSWRTLFLFPVTTITHTKSIADIMHGYVKVLHKDDTPAACAAVISKNVRTCYIYTTPFIWPVRLLWSIVASLFFIAIFIIYGICISILALGQWCWLIFTLPIRWLLKSLDD